MNRFPLHIIVVPGLFSPRWLMVPLRRGLEREFETVEIWDHPKWIGEIPTCCDALAQRLIQMERSVPTAIISHSFGDWIVRDTLANRIVRRPTHLVSLAPVVTDNPAAKFAGRLIGDRIDEIAIMRNPALAGRNLMIPPDVRHLAMWPRIDPWIQHRAYRSPQTIECNVWATHNSIPLQPKIWSMISKFLKCGAVLDREPARAYAGRFESVAATAVSTRIAHRAVHPNHGQYESV